MNSPRFTPWLAAALLLGGCTLAPEYKKPQAPVPAEWPTGLAAGGSTAPAPVSTAPLGEWKSFFVNEKMRRVIELALANNRDLRTAALNVELAQAAYRVQRAALFPEIDAGAAGSKQRIPPYLSMTGQGVTSEQYSVNLGVSAWEIDFFGRLRSLKDAALEQYFASEEARRSAQIALISEVAYAYLLVAADREGLRLAQLTFEAQQASYNLVRERCAAGISTELDLRQAQAPLETARVDMARYAGLVAQDVNLLNLLVGATVDAALLPDELAAVGALKEIAPNLPSEVLARRPDILQSEHQLKSMNANIGAARAAFFPRIALTTSVGTASDALAGLFHSSNNAWIFGGSASVPIFDAGTNLANLKIAKVDRDIAVAQYEKTIQAAFREVADGLALQKTKNDQVKAQQLLVDANAQAHRLAMARYDKQIDNYLSVLDAERSLYSAQQGMITVRLARLANLVRLYTAMGGGA